MADNITANGNVVATDDIGGVHHQRVKIMHGADGVATDASAAAPLPVTVSGVSTAANQSTAIGHLANILAALGGTLTVDAGTVTINLPAGASTAANQATIISHLDGVEGLLATIDADTGSLVTTLGNLLTELQAKADLAETQPVSVASLPLPTGAATAANQTTLIGHVDGIEGLLTTMDADTGSIATAAAAIQAAAEAIQTAVETLDNIVAGNEAQVDVVTLPNVTVGAALPAGTNNIGDVDVATVAIPTAIYCGQTAVTTAGTQVALAGSQAILSGVTIKALHANTGDIYVGDSNVSSTTGIVLDAGEQVFLEIANLATVYIDASVSGEGVSFVAS